MIRLACAVAAASLGCAAPAPSWRSPDEASWNASRARLEMERGSRPARTWSAGVRVTMHEPRSGRTVDARGAMAVSPGRAVRMILVGPAGSTMLDAWASADRWCVTVPALELSRRGGAEEPPDLPVGFLRWWSLSPLGGVLMAARSMPGEELWVLRAAGGVVELREQACARGDFLDATRRVAGRTERVRECRSLGGLRPGDTAEYADLSTGLRVQVEVESVSDRRPDDAAFVEPGAEDGT